MKVNGICFSLIIVLGILEIFPVYADEDPAKIILENSNHHLIETHATVINVPGLKGIVYNNLVNKKNPISGIHSPKFLLHPFDEKNSKIGVLLNYEHLFDGDPESSLAMFVPRFSRSRLFSSKDYKTHYLVISQDDNPWKVSSVLEYEIEENGDINFKFSAKFYEPKLFNPYKRAFFFFANYFNQKMDEKSEMNFLGINGPNEEEHWVLAPKVKNPTTINSTKGDTLPVAIRHFNNQPRFEYPQFSQPFFYNKLDDKTVFILMLDKVKTDDEEVRFAINRYAPDIMALDFMYAVKNMDAKKVYSLRGKIVVKTWNGQEDIKKLFFSWKNSKSKK